MKGILLKAMLKIFGQIRKDIRLATINTQVLETRGSYEGSREAIYDPLVSNETSESVLSKFLITLNSKVLQKQVFIDGGYRENMQRIAEQHPGSPLAERYGGCKPSHKEIKTRDAINKHRKRVAREGFSANKSKTL